MKKRPDSNVGEITRNSRNADSTREGLPSKNQNLLVLRGSVDAGARRKLEDYSRNRDVVETILRKNIDRIGKIRDKNVMDKLYVRFGKGLIDDHVKSLMENRYDFNYRLQRKKIDTYLKRLYGYFEGQIPEDRLGVLYRLFGKDRIDNHIQIIRYDRERKFRENTHPINVIKRMDQENASKFINSPLAMPLKVGSALKSIGTRGVREIILSIERAINAAPDLVLLLKYMGIETPNAIRGFVEGVISGFNSLGVELGTFAAQAYLDPKAVAEHMRARLTSIAASTWSITVNPAQRAHFLNALRMATMQTLKKIDASQGKDVPKMIGNAYAVFLVSIAGVRGVKLGVKNKLARIKKMPTNMTRKATREWRKSKFLQMNKAQKRLYRIKQGLNLSRKILIGSLIAGRQISPEFFSSGKILNILNVVLGPKISKIPNGKERILAQKNIVKLANRLPLMELAKRREIVNALARTFLLGSPSTTDTILVFRLFNDSMSSASAEEKRVVSKYLLLAKAGFNRYVK